MILYREKFKIKTKDKVKIKIKKNKNYEALSKKKSTKIAPYPSLVK